MLLPGQPLSRNNLQQLDYAGNFSPLESWNFLRDNANAQFIDVRTAEEWAYVGHPDLDDLDKVTHYISWLFYPAMNINPEFVEQVKLALKPELDTPILLLCRSGIRSAYAAHALTQVGFTACYNIVGGFEGDLDDDHRRGRVNGWQLAGLPWDQN